MGQFNKAKQHLRNAIARLDSNDIVEAMNEIVFAVRALGSDVVDRVIDLLTLS